MSDPKPKKVVQQFTNQNQSNFGLSFFFLPKEKRQAMVTLYAFCRHVDDIVDNNLASGQAEIDWWRGEIQQLKKGEAHHPISAELAKISQRFKIPVTYFDDLLNGVEMDLHKNRYQTFDELFDYCYHVASVVGLICLKIFETREQETEKYAIHLGVALQLTNILRDIEEDMDRGRIYLPQEELHQFGYTDKDLHHRTYNQAFINLMRFQVDRAKEFYRKAEGYSLTPDWKKCASAQIMGNIYYALLEEIEKSDYAVFEKRIRLTRSQKITIALMTYFKNRYFAITGFTQK